MAMWDVDGDEFVLKQAFELWRLPVAAFFERYLARPLGSRRLPTLSEVLAAVTRALHAELGEAADPSLALVVRIGDDAIGPAPSHEDAEPFGQLFADVKRTWIESLPARPPTLAELVRVAGRLPSALRTGWVRWDDVALPDKVSLTFESAAHARVVAPLAWDEELEPPPDDESLEAKVNGLLDAPPTDVGALATDADPRVRAAVALTHRAWILEAPERAAAYEADDDVVVRAAFVKNDDTLRCLAAHPRYDVRAAVAQNAWVPAEALRDLARQHATLRRLVARQNAPLDVLDALSRDDDVDVRRTLARNRRCPKELLARLASDPDRRVARAAQR